MIWRGLALVATTLVASGCRSESSAIPAGASTGSSVPTTEAVMGSPAPMSAVSVSDSSVPNSEDAGEDTPQATQGDGWRLLAADRTGETFRTGVATDAAQLAALWKSLDLTGQPRAAAKTIPVELALEVATLDGGPRLTATYREHAETYSPAPSGTMPDCE